MQCPFVEQSIVLDRLEFTLFLFDEEKVWVVQAFQLLNGAVSEVFLNEVVAFFNFFLHKGKEATR